MFFPLKSVIEGWGPAFDLLKSTNFTDYEEDVAIVAWMIGESPTRAFMYVRVFAIATCAFHDRPHRFLSIRTRRLNKYAKERAVERGVMDADTPWDAHWDELYKGCAFRTLFQPSPTLTDLYCGMLGQEGRARGQLAQSSVAIHVRTGGSA